MKRYAIRIMVRDFDGAIVELWELDCHSREHWSPQRTKKHLRRLYPGFTITRKKVERRPIFEAPAPYGL